MTQHSLDNAVKTAPNEQTVSVSSKTHERPSTDGEISVFQQQQLELQKQELKFKKIDAYSKISIPIVAAIIAALAAFYGYWVGERNSKLEREIAERKVENELVLSRQKLINDIVLSDIKLWARASSEDREEIFRRLYLYNSLHIIDPDTKAIVKRFLSDWQVQKSTQQQPSNRLPTDPE